MRVPDFQVADDERMLGVRPDALDALAEIDAVESRRAVDLVVVEPHERQRANVNRLLAAVGLEHREFKLLGARRGRLVAEAVLATLRRDVAGEGVQAVRPPEAGAFVAVEA